MKKLIALLLAAIMVLSLAACASSPAADQPANDQTTADTTTTTTEETKTEEKTEDTAASGDVEVVTYYCSIGAYLSTLQAEVANWNETTGKEKGVEIQIISDINDYSNNARALMQGGTFYDLVDAGTGSADWIVSGWIQDLNAIDNAELKELIAGYEPYIQNGINIQQGILVALPLEVVPIKFAVNLDLFEKNGLELPKTWEDVYNCAKVITENGNGEEFGYGWCTWTAGMIRRGTFKVCMNSTGRGWFDPNTATYDFSQFKPVLEIEAKMMQEGLLLGADDLGIDEIRAQFAAGKVGMFYAPSYDYGVYTSQFPAECNWTVIDPPAMVDETPYKGVYLDRVGCSITAPAYEAASDTHKQAIIDAFIFLNSDELNSKKVTFTQDVKDFTSYSFKPQLKTVGPKYGKLLGGIKQALSALNGNQAMDELKDKGSLTLDINGSEVVLYETDLLIDTAQIEGYVSEQDNDITVVLDTNLTPELIEEGFVRELISKVQTMRKEAGFEVMDRIRLYAADNEKILTVLKDHMDEIKDEVLADEIVLGSVAGYEKEWSINGESVRMGVEKTQK